jgi:hypothetical protein
MTFARRLAAATMALVLALFPLAMERCRTSCVAAAGQVTQAAPSAHACHEAASDDDSSARLDPMAGTCSHSDEAAYESVSLAAGQGRTLVPLVAIHPLLRDVSIPSAIPTDWAPRRSVLPRVVLALDLPLRL